jgi:hypothetical protein
VKPGSPELGRNWTPPPNVHTLSKDQSMTCVTGFQTQPSHGSAVKSSKQQQEDDAEAEWTAPGARWGVQATTVRRTPPRP